MPENGGFKKEANGGSTSIEMTKLSEQQANLRHDIEKGIKKKVKPLKTCVNFAVLLLLAGVGLAIANLVLNTQTTDDASVEPLPGTENNFCEPNPCENEAVCFSGANGFLCVCPDGYEGANCGVETNECDSDPCQNGGMCTDMLNGYTCTCSPAFGGDDCSITLPAVEYDDLYTGRFSSKSIYPRWTTLESDDQDWFITMNSNNEIVKRAITNPYEDAFILVPNTLYDKYDSIFGWSLSADQKFAFYRYNYIKEWRSTSYKADFAIWDVEANKEIVLESKFKDNRGQVMEWSPTGHKLVFVHDYDLYVYLNLGTDNTATLASPGNGEQNVMYYGVPTWQNQEEQFGDNRVFFWSPNSQRVVFLQSDATNVELVEFSKYNNVEDQYPETVKIAYPKSGTEISDLTLWWWDVDDQTLVPLPAPEFPNTNGFKNPIKYFSKLTWTNDDTFLATWINRAQTHSVAYLCTANNCVSDTKNEEIVEGGWVGSFQPFAALWETGTNNYWTIYAREDQDDADDGRWQIAYIGEQASGAQWVTRTNYDILLLLHHDAANGYIYFWAAYNIAGRRHILRVSADGRDVAEPECMTCYLIGTNKYPDSCGWIEPSFNSDASSVVLNCRGPEIPRTFYIPIASDGRWGAEVVIEENSELQAEISSVAWPQREYGTYTSANWPEKPYNYEIWRPADFDPTKKYPLLIYVYAGIEFQEITERYTVSTYKTFMPSARQMIVASVDGRGSAFDGYKFMRENYLKLGQHEPEDQTDFARYLLSTYDYIDAENVGIFGWSYGGFTTAHTVGYDAGNTFSCALSVAPLADWRWYDAMYAERYMGLPSENDDGYTKASIITAHNLDNFNRVSYTLIHGTLDDNVHFQHAAQMEKALVEADVDFDDFYYADEPHSINVGPGARKHVYHQIDNRLSYCLGRLDHRFGEPELNMGACASFPCKNGGSCSTVEGGVGYQCSCVDGYTAYDCSIDIDDCAAGPCMNGGTCVDGVNSYTCECTNDFNGPQCANALVPTVKFDDLFNGRYSSKSIYPNWDESTDYQGDFVTMNDNNEIVRRDIATPYTDSEVIAPNGLYDVYEGINGYSLSADAKFAFFRYNYKKVWRHSYTADFAIWDVENMVEVQLPAQFKNGMIHVMLWSPTGHNLVFVHEWDVYVMDELPSPTANLASPGNGEKNKMYYGIPDWMYEEEQISDNKVMYWNTDSTKIAFLQSIDENVDIIEYSMYNDIDSQYPETVEIAYSKAGRNVAQVNLWVYDLNETALIGPINAPVFQEWNGDKYFSKLSWADADSFVAIWLNRAQNESVAYLCTDADNGVATTDRYNCASNPSSIEIVSGGWVGSFGPFQPLWKPQSAGSGVVTPGKNYWTIYARPDQDDPEDGRWQIAEIDNSDVAAIPKWVTRTNYDILSLLHYDEVNDYIYFWAAYNLPSRRHILRVKSSESNVADPECMTCYLIGPNKYPDHCGWIEPSFNLDGSRVVLNCRGPYIPYTLHIFIEADGTWSEEIILEDNAALLAEVESVRWPQREYGQFPSAQWPEKPYNYEIWKPADFDPSKKYPLLIEVYAGPEFQKITETWTTSMDQTYMVSDRQIIVASVDGRGSAFEGYKFMRSNYKKLGQYEPVDQSEFARYLVDNFDYIDGDHVALWGWSYGGYTTSHTLGYDGGKTIQCGVAVAPLADWRYYDAMYAERYMGHPDENVDGYDKASIVLAHDLNNFKHVSYTLIHGTADDNVHFMSAAQMEKALVEADVDFDDFFYADQAHSINIGNASKHVFRQIENRISHCLGRLDQSWAGNNQE